MSLNTFVEAINIKTSANALNGIVASVEAQGFDIRSYLKASYDKTCKYHLSRKFVEVESEAVQINDPATPVTTEDLEELLLLAKRHQELGAKSKSALQAERVHFMQRSEEHRALLTALLAKTGLKGIGKSVIKKHADIYEFEVMRGITYEEKQVKEWPIYGEPKHDGMRVELLVEEGSTSIKSREGFDVKSLSLVKDQLGEMAKKYAEAIGVKVPFVLEAEGIGGDGSFNSTMSALGSDKPVSAVKLFAFCIVELDEFKGEKIVTMEQLRERTIAARTRSEEFSGAGSNVQLEFVPSVILKDAGEAAKFYEQQRERGLEGAIYKQPKMPYKPTKNKGWLKRKPKETVDVRIVGVEEGIGENKGRTGAIVVDYKGVNVSVGSGLTSTTHRVEFGEKVLIPLESRPYSDRDRIWQQKESYIGMIAEISFFEETPDGSLRHPVFERLRTDKNSISYS